MKKSLFYIVVIIALSAAIGLSAMKILEENDGGDKAPEISTGFFDAFEKQDPQEIENEIREAERKRMEQFGGSTEKQIKETLEKLEKGEINLRQIFSDTFFAGDSLMNGLEIYGILSPDLLATQVSASLYHLSENVAKILAANPGELFLHYGINMISEQSGQLESFLSSYEEIILSLKQGLPETRIIVSGLFPVDTSVATEVRFTMVDEYNKALSEMCEKIGVEFLDSTKAFEGNEDYYGGDGIHVSSGFYSDVWLPFIIENKGIIG